MVNPKTKGVVVEWLFALTEQTGDGSFATAAKVLIRDLGGRPEKNNNRSLLQEVRTQLEINALRDSPLSERRIIERVARQLAPYENPKNVVERIRRKLRKFSSTKQV